MKRICIFILTAFLLTSMVSAQSWVRKEVFIVDSAGDADPIETILTTATATNGTEFTSSSIHVSRPNFAAVVAITVTFTGDGSMDGEDVDFIFQVSHDDGTTWSSTDYVTISRASDTDHVTNVVYYTETVQVYGISHIRLWKVTNNDAANSITDVNATLSQGR